MACLHHWFDPHRAVVEHLGHPGLAGVESVYGLMDGGDHIRIVGIQLGAGSPELADAGLKV